MKNGERKKKISCVIELSLARYPCNKSICIVVKVSIDMILTIVAKVVSRSLRFDVRHSVIVALAATKITDLMDSIFVAVI